MCELARELESFINLYLGVTECYRLTNIPLCVLQKLGQSGAKPAQPRKHPAHLESLYKQYSTLKCLLITRPKHN